MRYELARFRAPDWIAVTEYALIDWMTSHGSRLRRTKLRPSPLTRRTRGALNSPPRYPSSPFDRLETSRTTEESSSTPVTVPCPHARAERSSRPPAGAMMSPLRQGAIRQAIEFAP